MKDTLIVLVDSSTKQTSSANKYGESTAAFTARWNRFTGQVVKAGTIYQSYQGPNKAFYSGVISALETCYTLVNNGDRVFVAGDCQTVMNHINGRGLVLGELTPYRNQVFGIKAKYRCEVSFVWIPRDTKHYYEVDQLAKRSRGFYIDNFGKTSA